jgi:hypothetical protein
MITQKGSGWSSPQKIPFSGVGPSIGYGVANLQCPAKNYCVVIGLNDVSLIAQQQYAQTWQDGQWGSPHVFSSTGLGNKVTIRGIHALSCPTTTWCLEVGQYVTATGRTELFDVTMSNGQWGSLSSLKGDHDSTNTNTLNSISCVASGTCVATGESAFGSGNEASVPLIMSESGGHWATARTIPIPGVTSPQLDPVQVPVVSCVRGSLCTGLVAVRSIYDTIGVATMRGSGQWNVVRVTDLGQYTEPALLALSCFKGACVALGWATAPSPASESSPVPLIVTARGAW